MPRFLPLVLLLVLWLASPALGAPVSARLATLLARSQQEAAAGRYAAARTLLQDYRPQSGEAGLVALQLGNLWAQEGQWAEALPSYREAARLRPDDPAAQANLGVTALQLGRYTEAAEAFERAIPLAQSPGRSRYGAAVARYQLEQPTASREHLRVLLDDPAAATMEALQLFVRIDIERQDPGAALPALRRWLDARPSSAPGWHLRAQVAVALQDYPQAVAALWTLQGLRPLQAAEREQLAALYAALALPLPVAQATGEDTPITRARALAAGGRSDAALALLAERPQDVPAQELRGELLRRRGDWTAAARLYRQLADRHPQRDDLRYMLALCLLNRGDLAAAVTALEAVGGAGPLRQTAQQLVRALRPLVMP